MRPDKGSCLLSPSTPGRGAEGRDLLRATEDETPPPNVDTKGVGGPVVSPSVENAQEADWREEGGGRDRLGHGSPQEERYLSLVPDFSFFPSPSLFSEVFFPVGSFFA